MNTMTYDQAINRLEQFFRERRIARHKWIGIDANGYETACLLVALSPEVGISHDPCDCPVDIMPAWLAELTPWLDDAPSAGAWWGFVERFVAVARRWSVLTSEEWRRLDYACRAVALREVRRHVSQDPCIAEGVDNVLMLLDRASAGDYIDSGECMKVQEMVGKTIVATVPETLDDVAWGQVMSLALAAREATMEAVWDLPWAVSGTAAWGIKAASAKWVSGMPKATEETRIAEALAADRIVDGVLAVLEVACDAAEKVIQA